MSPGSFYAAFLIAAMIATGSWTELDRMPILAKLITALVIVGLCACAWLKHPILRGLPLPKALPRPARLRAENLFLGIVPTLPAAAYFALTWHQEFPFSGDHDYHLSVAISVFGFIVRAFFILLIFGAGVWALRKSRYLPLWIGGAFSVLFMLSFRSGLPIGFARYPGLGYWVTSPLVRLFGSGLGLAPQEGLRFGEFLSLPFWLFFLRPRFVGKWPDRVSAVAVVLFFLQPTMTYYLSSSYLEPWGIIFAMAATELALIDEISPTVFLLLGVGALVKEQVILLLPFFVIARIWSEKKRKFPAIASTLAVAFVSAFPFLLYYQCRKLAGIWRKAALADLPDLFSAHRFYQFWSSWGAQWTAIETAILGVAVLALVFSKALRAWRGSALILVLAALSSSAFFYFDRISVYWTGYSRFNLLSFAVLSMVLSVIVFELPRKLLLSMVALAVLGRAPGICSSLAAASGPDAERSYLEYNDSPLFLPIRELARSIPSGAGVRRIHVHWDLSPELVRFLPVVYPSLASRFRFSGGAETDCACGERGSAELFVPDLHANLADGARFECRRRLEETCAHVVSSKALGGEIGFLGY